MKVSEASTSGLTFGLNWKINHNPCQEFIKNTKPMMDENMPVLIKYENNKEYGKLKSYFRITNLNTYSLRNP